VGVRFTVIDMSVLTLVQVDVHVTRVCVFPLRHVYTIMLVFEASNLVLGHGEIAFTSMISASYMMLSDRCVFKPAPGFLREPATPLYPSPG